MLHLIHEFNIKLQVFKKPKKDRFEHPEERHVPVGLLF